MNKVSLASIATISHAQRLAEQHLKVPNEDSFLLVMQSITIIQPWYTSFSEMFTINREENLENQLQLLLVEILSPVYLPYSYVFRTYSRNYVIAKGHYLYFPNKLSFYCQI